LQASHSCILFHNKCLTTDNLEKRGCPHNPICRLCFLHPETAPHISASWPYSLAVWTQLLARLHLPLILAPAATTYRLDGWWLHSSMSATKEIVTRWRSLALLIWWMLRKETNNQIFNNVATNEATLVDKVTNLISGVLPECLECRGQRESEMLEHHKCMSKLFF
jgi:hypothetical protein